MAGEGIILTNTRTKSAKGSTARGGKSGGRGPAITAGIIALVLVLVAGVYVGAHFLAGDKIARNTTVAGIDIGGMTSEQATEKLTKELAPAADRPITLSANGKSAKFVPSASGMTLDAQATVQQAGAGSSWNPAQLWRTLKGGSEVTPVYKVDETALKNAVAKQASTFQSDAKDATIAIKGTEVVTTEAVKGTVLDQPAAVSAIKQAWRTSQQVNAPLTKGDPNITTAEVTKVADEFAKPALSGPVTVRTNGRSFPVDVKVIAPAITFSQDGGTVHGSFNMDKIWNGAQAELKDLGLQSPHNASFTFDNNQPKVVPSKDGVSISKDAFVKAVQPALTRTGAARTVDVAASPKKADITTEQAQKMGVKEVMGEFTTNFPYAEYRNTNLSRAAAGMNGTLVKPGAVFSLNDTLGERTAANGYVDGYVIEGSRTVKETGGGVSQSATTVYNAMFFAGLEDVEHHPHTLYFPRYPAGREATVYYGSLDLRFRNNTPNGVVVQAFVKKATPGNQGSITVRMWGTKQYTKVTSSALNKSDYYDAAPETVKAANCEPQSASPGFTVHYERYFYKGSQLVKREPFVWKYEATPEVTCA